MVVDASAVLAIVLKESDAERFEETLIARGGGLMSAVNYWEVLAKSWVEFGRPGQIAAKAVLERLGVDVVVVSADDAERAAMAFERFGKRAAGKLNLGDCFAYALAKTEGDGLLFKGDDFRQTDITSALR